jgi:hypothetical protein
MKHQWPLSGTSTGPRRPAESGLRPGDVVTDAQGNVTVYSPTAIFGLGAKLPGGKE